MKKDLQTLPGYVHISGENYIHVRVFSSVLKKKIKKLGAKRAWLIRILSFDCSMWKIYYEDDSELARIYGKLRDLGVPFSVNKGGWGPSAIFKKLRNDGLIKGEYKRLNWTGEGKNKVNIEEV